MNNQLKMLIIVGLVLKSMINFAQPTGPKGKQQEGQKVENLKNQFYREKLNLTPDQERQFNPVFKEHQQKMRHLRKELKVNQTSTKNAQNEQELRLQIQKNQQLKTALIDEETSFETQCIILIGTAKTAQLIGLDEEFKKEMKERLKARKKEKSLQQKQ